MDASYHRHDISDAAWELIAPYLPGQRGQWGGIAEDNRRFINAVLSHTYAYLEVMDRWLKDHGMPPITRVYKTTRDGKRLTLEDECLQSCSLPSIAYGFKRCSLKHMQREIQSHLQDKGIGTKAQQALKLQHEQCKLERKTKSREQKEAEKDRQFAIRQEKKKAKHRGR